MLADLYGRTTNGVRFELERMRAFVEACEHPERACSSVLIAGTNGKGSTAAMWAEALRADGHAVGLYTSPHLVRYNERIRVDGRPVSDAALLEHYATLLTLEARLAERLTFFEATTLFAFLHFRAAKVDACVLEVGMGGRLDATNVASPSLCVITSIGLDHEQYLGHTLASIAREKAGILRAGVPAAVGPVPDEAWRSIMASAPDATPIGLGRQAGFGVDEGDDDDSGGWIEWNGQRVSAMRPRLFGAHQLQNAQLFVLSSLLSAGGPLSLSERALRAGLEADWPGRYQRLTARNGARLVIDGAHNPDGVRALIAALDRDPEHARRPRVLVYGALAGRVQEDMLPPLAVSFDRVVLVRAGSPRALEPEALAALLPGARTASGVEQALTWAAEAAGSGGTVVVAGSLYLAGDVLALLEGRPKDAIFDFR